MTDYQAQTGNWDTDFPADGSDKKPRFENKATWMKMGPGKYTVRLVGKYVKFLRHGDVFGPKTRVITHEDYRNEDPAWKAGWYPRETYAIHVIDRADGKVKLLEKGNSIFKYFAQYKNVKGVNPAAREALDFIISVEWPGGDRRQAKYSVFPGKENTLTDAEMEMVKQNAAPLQTMYKTTPLETIKQMWENVPLDKRTPPKREKKGEATESAPQAPAPVLEEKMPNAPANDADIFADDNGGDSTTSF